MIKTVIICRCEEVLLRDIITSIENGAETLKAIKMETRAGMGICQGRTCRVLLEQAIAPYTDITIQETNNIMYKNPVRPISLANLSRSGKDSSQ
ncbi:(2Fe-2S)-binding protein [Oceanobacillus polygoni]|uniref:NAD(P)H-nitrite reductase large subunit n=1 Tax=Oceanobacillus polygoni TaxID=1235259 RepID=A0A9X1CDP1_9BACI|nr:(2Fe-2S)-binding protein [Oceanobacillus polygoni]MBP2079256.1 NAD(P)H-nitrite reductase large subunit [Oceanobacillus polygoni]